MNEQGAQQEHSPRQQQQQQQQHEERAILSQLKKTHGIHPGTFQVTINSEQPASVLRNTHPGIRLDKPERPDHEDLHMVFINENERFMKEQCRDGYNQQHDTLQAAQQQSMAHLGHQHYKRFASLPPLQTSFPPQLQPQPHPDPLPVQQLGELEQYNIGWSPEDALPDRRTNETVLSPELFSTRIFEDFIADPCRIDVHPFQTIHGNPHSRIKTPVSYKVCERCGTRVTGAPHDIKCNIRRHQKYTCKKRNAPRVRCGVPGCNKDYARLDGMRAHELKRHGIVRSGRGKADRGTIEGNSMRRPSTATVVTDGTELNLPQNTKGYFIQQFSEELLTAISPTPASSESIDRVCEVLPDLLKHYAIRVTKRAQSQNEKNAVAFVRQNRTYIAAALHEKWCGYEESTQRKIFPDQDHAEMDWQERVDHWDIADSADISQPEELLKYLPDANDEDEASDLPDPSLYKPHLLGGEPYRWLISRLRKEFLLARPEAFAMDQISEAILQQFPQSEKASMSFHLDWNLLAFLDDQGYKGNFADEIPRAITITGSSTSAQATSCERYLLDTWPSTGAFTLMALKNAISERNDDTLADDLQDSSLRISLKGTHTEVEIVGDKDFITDIGEQLGWMGAALRSSKVDGQMCYCVPLVTFSNGIFTIEYSSELVKSTETILNGNCWHRLFNNPAIVRGFPIATRRTESPDEGVLGLEIPLNMMAGIAEAKRVTDIDGRLLLKGFSTLLIPTKRVDDLVIWHMIYNEDDSHISYFDFRGIDISDISVKGLTFPALESSRHILGWCSVARNLAGSKHAKYDIKTSGLSQPGQGWTFEKVSISGGKIINGGVTFGKGNINTPLHLRRQPVYVKQIYEASCKYVIFYDVGDKRAWLVNGAAALLHLARAYLVFASKHRFLSTLIKFHLDDLWGPEDEYEASAPFKILCNSTNMDQVIYEDWKPANEAVIDAKGNFVETAKVKDAHFRFRDQVDEIYHIWEQIQEFQTKMTDNIRLTDRDKLQGFNFMDVVTGESPIKPRFTYLERSGRGWVDLARSLDAITLFGCGFGELLQPSSESNKLCHSWSHVPTGKDYLAVSMSDVSAIFDKRGNATSRPMELVDGLFWHKADKLFESCECAGTGARKRPLIFRRGTLCDRVQVLLPPSLGRKVDPGPLEEKGAVIFGRSERYRWHWPNQGQPNETTGLDEDSESERAQKKARSSSSSQVSQVSEIFSGDTQQTPATSVSEDASSSPRTESPVKR